MARGRGDWDCTRRISGSGALMSAAWRSAVGRMDRHTLQPNPHCATYSENQAPDAKLLRVLVPVYDMEPARPDELHAARQASRHGKPARRREARCGVDAVATR